MGCGGACVSGPTAPLRCREPGHQRDAGPAFPGRRRLMGTPAGAASRAGPREGPVPRLLHRLPRPDDEVGVLGRMVVCEGRVMGLAASAGAPRGDRSTERWRHKRRAASGARGAVRRKARRTGRVPPRQTGNRHAPFTRRGVASICQRRPTGRWRRGPPLPEAGTSRPSTGWSRGRRAPALLHPCFPMPIAHGRRHRPAHAHAHDRRRALGTREAHGPCRAPARLSP